MDMTNEQILKKAIEKAVKGGWDNWVPEQIFKELNYANKPWVYSVIFSHDFAKAFWGKREVCSYCGVELDKHVRSDEDEDNCGFRWWKSCQYHLQQMVLEKDPIKYLEKFL